MRFSFLRAAGPWVGVATAAVFAPRLPTYAASFSSSESTSGGPRANEATMFKDLRPGKKEPFKLLTDKLEPCTKEKYFQFMKGVEKVTVVCVAGRVMSGKSTLLNFLGDKGLPLFEVHKDSTQSCTAGMDAVLLKYARPSNPNEYTTTVDQNGERVVIHPETIDEAVLLVDCEGLFGLHAYAEVQSTVTAMWAIGAADVIVYNCNSIADATDVKVLCEASRALRQDCPGLPRHTLTDLVVFVQRATVPYGLHNIYAAFPGGKQPDHFRTVSVVNCSDQVAPYATAQRPIRLQLDELESELLKILRARTLLPENQSFTATSLWNVLESLGQALPRRSQIVELGDEERLQCHINCVQCKRKCQHYAYTQHPNHWIHKHCITESPAATTLLCRACYEMGQHHPVVVNDWFFLRWLGYATVYCTNPKSKEYHQKNNFAGNWGEFRDSKGAEYKRLVVEYKGHMFRERSAPNGSETTKAKST